MDLNSLATQPFTYPEVGATASARLPAGYHHIDVRRGIGTGRDRFEQAAAAVLRFGIQRGAGLRVTASSDIAEAGTVLVVRIGIVKAPCRVIYVVDEPNRRGFAYGTLAGHPEAGEELFSVEYDSDHDVVDVVIRAFSRPATWWARAGRPITVLMQRIVTKRYLRAV